VSNRYHVEQICPGETPGYRKALKRRARRARRRLQRLKLEDAPRRLMFRGYSL